MSLTGMVFVARQVFLTTMIDVSLCLMSCTYQMGWFTADNASNNFSAIREVAKQVNADMPRSDWDPKQHYVW